MKFKPFAIRNMTAEQVQIMLDKSVEAGAELHDPLWDYPLDMCTFWGVQEDNSTLTHDQLTAFGLDCVEITFDQLDEHLSLVSDKEEVEEVPYEDTIDWSQAPEGYDYWIVSETIKSVVPPTFFKLSGGRYVDKSDNFWRVKDTGRSFTVYGRPDNLHSEPAQTASEDGNITPEQSTTVTPKTVEMLAEELGDIIHVYPNGEYGVLGTNDVEISIKSLQQLERYVALVSELKSFEGQVMNDTTDKVVVYCVEKKLENDQVSITHTIEQEFTAGPITERCYKGMCLRDKLNEKYQNNNRWYTVEVED